MATSYGVNGIVYPGTQASESGANTFDDYEEGTFTMSLSGQSSETFALQLGRYTKIGRVVFFGGVVQTNALAGTATTAILMTGLPYTQVGASYGSTVNVGATYQIDMPSGFTFMGGEVTVSATTINIAMLGDMVANPNMTVDAWADNATIIQVGGFYDGS
jgi:hypothetical protein